MKVRFRQKILGFQKKFREFLKRPMRKKFEDLYAKRKQASDNGQSTKEIDEKIAYLKRRRGNESLYGTANAWLTPIEHSRRAQRLTRIRSKKSKK